MRYRDDECGKTRAVLQNLDDQTEYSLLGYANGV
jgi:predicted nucleic acid-binding Zn ribbon protein